MQSCETKLEPCEWSEEIETVLKHILRSCSRRRVLHMEMAIDYQNKFSTLMLSNIIIGPLAGLISTISLAIDTSVTEMTIISSSLGFLSGTIAAITKFGKYDESSNIHKASSVKFSALEANIKRQLALPNRARSRPDEYLTFVDSSYESLVSSAPLTSFIVEDSIDSEVVHETDIIPVEDSLEPKPAELKPEPRLEYELNRMFDRK